MAKPVIGSTGWGGVLNDHLDDMATDIAGKEPAGLSAETEAALSATYVSTTGRPVHVSDYPPSAYGGSVSAGINAAIAAARAANATEVHFPAGTLVLDAPLLDDTSGNTAGLTFRGASQGTVLSADFDGDAILTLDGAGVLSQFQRGARIENLTFTQQGGRTGVDGVKSVASWYVRIENCNFEGLSGHGIHVPLRTDLSANPDDYGSLIWQLSQVRFASLNGYGIYAPIGLGFSMIADGCYWSTCASGGIYAGANLTAIRGGAFASCGETTGRGAVYLDYIGSTPYGFTLEGIELDGNYGAAVTLVSAYAWAIERCRFVPRANAANTAYRETAAIQLGDGTHQLVAIGTLRNNALRMDSGTWAYTWVNRTSVSAVYVDEYDTYFTSVSSGLTKRGGSTGANNENAMLTELGTIRVARWGDHGALPGASSTYRGQVRWVQGGSGVADRLVVCRKDAAGAYAWVDLF